MWPSISTKGIIWKRFLSAYNSINAFFTFTSLFLSSMREEEGPIGRREDVFSERGEIFQWFKLNKDICILHCYKSQQKEKENNNSLDLLGVEVRKGWRDWTDERNDDLKSISYQFPIHPYWEAISKHVYVQISLIISSTEENPTRIDWISMEVSPFSHPFLILWSREREERRSERERERQHRLWSRRPIERKPSRLENMHKY